MTSLEEWLGPGGAPGAHDHHHDPAAASSAAAGSGNDAAGTSDPAGPGDGPGVPAGVDGAAGGDGAAPMDEDDDDLLPPDLGLGTLSAEDIKWVDLEFLDLASGPPASDRSARNKNNPGTVLSDNFPDIFFGDAAFSSSLFNIDDFKPFGEPFGMGGVKDNALGVDLESVEKNILVGLCLRA